MNYCTIKEETLTGIGNAIREKTGTSAVIPTTQMAEVIANIEIGGNTGFRIAYGESAPEDTDMLWVKAAEPDAIMLTSKPITGNEELNTFVSALPEAARYLTAATVGSKIYLFGGCNEIVLTSIKVYDPVENSIATISTTMPTKACAFLAAVCDTKIYLFGGGHVGDDLKLRPSDVIYVFDTETNAITTISTTLLIPMESYAAVVYDMKVFLFGGYSTDTVYQSGIYVFDLKTETISALKATLPNAVAYHSAVAVGSKAYLFGGCNENGYFSDIHVFDLDTYTVTTLDEALPVAARNIAAAAVGSKIYLFGGRTADDRLSDIQVFDTETCTLSTLPVSLPAKTAFAEAATAGTSIYVFGGYDGTYDLPTIHEFVAKLPLAHNTLFIETSTDNHLFNLVENDEETAEIGIANVYLGNAEGVAEKVPAALYQDGAWVEI